MNPYVSDNVLSRLVKNSMCRLFLTTVFEERGVYTQTEKQKGRTGEKTVTITTIPKTINLIPIKVNVISKWQLFIVEKLEEEFSIKLPVNFFRNTAVCLVETCAITTDFIINIQ